MPDLISLLSNASQSLAGAQGAAATAAHNLQNVNTPGYSRQRAILEASVPEEAANGSYVGRGSRMVGVIQARDRFLEAQVPYTFAQASQSKIKSSTLDGVHIFDSGLAGGVGDAISSFFDSIRLLSQNPTDPALRDGTANAGTALQTAFQRESRNIDTARSSIDQQVESVVLEANDLASKVADLNHKIVMARLNAGSAPNDLMDQRQVAVDRLSQLVGGTPIPDSQGRITVTLPRGGALVAGERSSKLVTRPDTANRGHVMLSIVDKDGGRISVGNDSFSGEMGGLLSARDYSLKNAASSLDQLAFDFAGAVSAVHQNGQDLNGDPGEQLFDAGSTIEGAAARFSMSSAVARDPARLATRGLTGGKGDNATALKMLELERTVISAGLTPVNAYARLTSDFGAETSGARSAAEHDTALHDHLTKMRDAVSGVSVDEELIEMTKAQRAYEAIGKVIKTGDQMLETLLGLKS